MRCLPARCRALGAIPERRLGGGGGKGRAGALETLALLAADPKAQDRDLLKALEEVMPGGVAFHHADLGPVARELVEAAFRCGAVSVLCATSTLAGGVNLPARRVIVKHPFVGTGTPLESTMCVCRAGAAPLCLFTAAAPPHPWAWGGGALPRCLTAA